MRFNSTDVFHSARGLADSADILHHANTILASVSWPAGIFGDFAESAAFHHSIATSHDQILSDTHNIATTLHEKSRGITTTAQQVVNFDADAFSAQIPANTIKQQGNPTPDTCYHYWEVPGWEPGPLFRRGGHTESGRSWDWWLTREPRTREEWREALIGAHTDIEDARIIPVPEAPNTKLVHVATQDRDNLFARHRAWMQLHDDNAVTQTAKDLAYNNEFNRYQKGENPQTTGDWQDRISDRELVVAKLNEMITTDQDALAHDPNNADALKRLTDDQQSLTNLPSSKEMDAQFRAWKYDQVY